MKVSALWLMGILIVGGCACDPPVLAAPPPKPAAARARPLTAAPAAEVPKGLTASFRDAECETSVVVSGGFGSADELAQLRKLHAAARTAMLKLEAHPRGKRGHALLVEAWETTRALSTFLQGVSSHPAVQIPPPPQLVVIDVKQTSNKDEGQQDNPVDAGTTPSDVNP